MQLFKSWADESISMMDPTVRHLGLWVLAGGIVAVIVYGVLRSLNHHHRALPGSPWYRMLSVFLTALIVSAALCFGVFGWIGLLLAPYEKDTDRVDSLARHAGEIIHHYAVTLNIAYLVVLTIFWSAAWLARPALAYMYRKMQVALAMRLFRLTISMSERLTKLLMDQATRGKHAPRP